MLVGIVDARRANRLAVAGALRALPGFGPVRMAEGERATQAVLLRFAPTPPDLLVIGGRMPSADGPFAIGDIRRREAARGLPRVPIVIASDKPDDLLAGLLEGADAGIPMPPHPDWVRGVAGWLLGMPVERPAPGTMPGPDPAVDAIAAVAAVLDPRVPLRGLMLWFFSPNTLLGGERPADRVADVGALVAAAKAESEAETEAESESESESESEAGS
jgi:CheY-like chemotaxis protein